MVFSDGHDVNIEEVETAKRAAALADIPVYGLFFGDPDGSASLEIDGQMVQMEADRSTLDTLANGTGAISVNVTVDGQDINAPAAHKCSGAECAMGRIAAAGL